MDDVTVAKMAPKRFVALLSVLFCLIGYITLSSMQLIPTVSDHNQSTGVRRLSPLHVHPASPASDHRNPHFFQEHPDCHHCDGRFTKNASMSIALVHTTLLRLLATWANYCKVPWFLAYGTLLGAWRDKDIIQWDRDGDIAMMRIDLLQLPLQHVIAADILFERNPYSAEPSSLDHSNTIDARLICKTTGVFLASISPQPSSTLKTKPRYLCSCTLLT